MRQLTNEIQFDHNSVIIERLLGANVLVVVQIVERAEHVVEEEHHEGHVDAEIDGRACVQIERVRDQRNEAHGKIEDGEKDGHELNTKR